MDNSVFGWRLRDGSVLVIEVLSKKVILILKFRLNSMDQMIL